MYFVCVCVQRDGQITDRIRAWFYLSCTVLIIIRYILQGILNFTIPRDLLASLLNFFVRMHFLVQLSAGVFAFFCRFYECLICMHRFPAPPAPHAVDGESDGDHHFDGERRGDEGGAARGPEGRSHAQASICIKWSNSPNTSLFFGKWLPFLRTIIL